MEPPPIRAELRLQTICLAVLSVVAVAFSLYWLRPVMIPFVVAAFLAIGLRPLVDWLELYVYLPRTLAVCVALLLALVAMLALGAEAGIALGRFTSNQSLEQYQSQVTGLLYKIVGLLPLEHFGVQPSEVLDYIRSPVLSAAQNVLVGVTSAIVSVVSEGLVVMVFLFFLLLSSVKRERPIGGALGEAECQIRAYLLTMTALSAACGISVGFVLAILGVKGAALFGFLTFLLNFIPNVGSFIATVLPLPVVWMSGDYTTSQAIMAIAIPGAIQFAIGNFLQPKLMGNSMKLHPVVILMALIFWGMLWGIVGMFFAVPITSIIRIACDRHDLTKPVANLMAGKLDLLREMSPAAVETPTA